MTTSCKDKWVRKFSITETCLHKTGFTIYKVTSLVFLKYSPDTASSVSVWKRYSDFKNLYKSIHATYKKSSIKEIFPKFAKPKYFGRFDKKVVDERSECANRLLEFIAKYTVLYTDDAFIKFFEISIDNFKSSNHSISSDSLDDEQHNHDTDNETLSQLDSGNSGITAGEFNRSHVCPSSQSSKQPDDDNMIVKSIGNSNDVNIKLNAAIISFGFNNILEECYGNLKKHELSSSLSSNNTTQVLSKMSKDFYHNVIIAAAHINAGHKHEHLEEYKEAYVQYKLGIMQLQHCVNIDPDIIRQRRVMEKVTKYVRKIDEIYRKYLNNDITMFVKPTMELKKYKIVKIMGSTTILVRDTEKNIERIVKTVAKPAGCIKGINNYILGPKVPFMVQLYAFIETDTTIFFILEYINGKKLWDMIASCNVDISKNKNIKRNCDTTRESNKNSMSSNRELDDKQNSSICSGEHHQDVSINQLLDKAKKLLISVDVTLKQSDSVASKLNEYGAALNNCNDKKKYYLQSNHMNSSRDDLGHLLSSHGLDTSVINIAKDIENLGDIETSYKNEPLTFKDVVKYIDEPPINTSEIIKNIYNETECEHWCIPEHLIRRWARQLLDVLETLHEQNIVLMNLRPDNLLIDQEGCIRLNCIIPQQGCEFIDCHVPYTAPELYMYISPVSLHPAADLWSFGIVLYELLTGIRFNEEDAYLFYSQLSFISIPSTVSENARSLLTNVLKFKPDERPNISEIKKHPFFEEID